MRGSTYSKVTTTTPLVVKVVPGNRAILVELGYTSKTLVKQPHGSNPYLGARNTQLLPRKGVPVRRGMGKGGGTSAT